MKITEEEFAQYWAEEGAEIEREMVVASFWLLVGFEATRRLLCLVREDEAE